MFAKHTESIRDRKKAMLRSMKSKVGVVGISYLFERKHGNVDFIRIYVSNITNLWDPSGSINYNIFVSNIY